MNLKKSSLIAIVTMTAAATTLLATGETASAAEVGSLDSTGKVQFTAQTGGIKNPPLNPIDPDKPLDPGTTTPGTDGPLSIDYVSSFDFGTQEISGETKVYNAKLDQVTVDGDTIDVPNFVQVTDNRGNNSGWHLTVAQNGQLTDGSDRELNGAEIQITKADVVTKSDSDIVAPTAATTITLNPEGTAATVMNAEAEQGMGPWVDRFGADATEGADAVTLTVPGKSAKYDDSAYETTLTWTLSDTPE